MPTPHLFHLVHGIDSDFIDSSLVFQQNFTNLDGWVSYWNHRNNRVSDIPRKPPQLLTATDFQALYIACWLFQPLEKGAFMIPLTEPSHVENISAALNFLPKRWSSHLSERNARSAGAGYAFLCGYSELLVQLEYENGLSKPSLFLKTEGHGAHSIAHLRSWVTKATTGRGNTQNQWLHTLATDPQYASYGIMDRAGENYDKPYEALLDHLKLKGKQIKIEEVIPVIITKLKKKTNGQVVNPDLLRAYEQSQGTSVPIPKSTLAELIKQVIVPTANKPDFATSKFVQKLQSAENALRSIAEFLIRDGGNTETAAVPRVFQEVRVSFTELDAVIQEFLAQVHEWRSI